MSNLEEYNAAAKVIEENNINIEVLYYYKKIEEYCTNPPCSKEYEKYFLELSKEKILKMAIDFAKYEREWLFKGFAEEIFWEVVDADSIKINWKG